MFKLAITLCIVLFASAENTREGKKKSIDDMVRQTMNELNQTFLAEMTTIMTILRDIKKGQPFTSRQKKYLEEQNGNSSTGYNPQYPTDRKAERDFECYMYLAKRFDECNLNVDICSDRQFTMALEYGVGMLKSANDTIRTLQSYRSGARECDKEIGSQSNARVSVCKTRIIKKLKISRKLMETTFTHTIVAIQAYHDTYIYDVGQCVAYYDQPSTIDEWSEACEE